MKDIIKISGWLLILGGLLWGYEGFTGNELQEALLGKGLADLVEMLVGLAAVVMAYSMLNMKKGK